MFGYMNKILRVDLTRNSIKEEDLKTNLAKNFVGGYGIGGKILYDEVPAKADPLGPENIIIYCTGPMTGTLFPSSGRSTIVAKSPLTGYFGDSNFGGFFGPMLKRSGYDLIIITGIAKKPCFLVITDGKVELKDASQIWGMDTIETNDAIKEILAHRNYQISCIGPAGENLVKFAAVMSGRGTHAAGRTGMGAVMGSKKLKAIAVYGSKEIPVSDPESLKRIYTEVCDAMSKDWGIQMTFKHGTAGFFRMLMELGDTPVRNWIKGSFPTDKITGETMTNTILKGRHACYLCPVACFRRVEIQDEPYTMNGSGPEYQTVAALGSLCENNNLEAIAKANDLCNRYGLDTISTGVSIAFAMECFEKGIIKKNETKATLSFGNKHVILELIKKIAFRDGLGDILAEGVKRASERIGSGTRDFAVHVRGLEVPMHDPRAFYGIGLGYAVGPTGARHTDFLLIGNQNPATAHDINSRAKITIEETKILVAVNALGLCFKPILGPKNQFKQIASAYSYVTGNKTSTKDLKLIGDRIFHLRRAFTLKHGSTAEEDKLPKRILEPLQKGPTKGSIVPIKKLLEDYYKLQDWDPKTGKPKREKLEKLGLRGIANDLWS